MGGKFKSIYLAQGRCSTQQICNNNPRLNKLQHVLYDLNQRPEIKEDDTFKVDLYSCPQFASNPIKREKMFQIQYVDAKTPVDRSLLGTGQDFKQYKKEMRDQMRSEARRKRKEKRSLRYIAAQKVKPKKQNAMPSPLVAMIKSCD